MKSFIELQKDRIVRLFWYLVAMTVRSFIPVKKGQCFFWSYSFNKYACNPKDFTEYLLENIIDDMQIYWAFDKDFDATFLDQRIHVVRRNTWAYIKAMYSSRFIINNKRSYKYDSYFVKKRNQKYIMMWHGASPMKRIEKDAEIQLGPTYCNYAKEDSKMCDLMISNSRFFSELIKSSFWYNGEILEKGVPRNDIFFRNTAKEIAIERTKKELGLSDATKLVLYAPTFRNGTESLHFYKIDWASVLPSLKSILDGDVAILLRLHPNIANHSDISSLMSCPAVYNVTKAPDITQYLLAADMMITDYTSAMFDFAMLNKPCFIYAVDINEYDRGFYFNFDELPFPVATNMTELSDNIKNFNKETYLNSLSIFNKNHWGNIDKGEACSAIYQWVKHNDLE